MGINNILREFEMFKFIIYFCLFFTVFRCDMFIGPETPTCQETDVQSILNWVYEYVEYRSDVETWGIEDYWQTPRQTNTLRTGDCEDMSIFVLFLVKQNVGIKGKLICYEDHVFVKIDGEYYETTKAKLKEIDKEKIFRIIDYDTAMMYASCHNNI